MLATKKINDSYSVSRVIIIYRKRRKFRGVKISWFLNYGLQVKFRGFRGSRFIHQ